MSSVSSPAFHGSEANVSMNKPSVVEHGVSLVSESCDQHSDYTAGTKEEAAVESSIKFSPPLYRQRYDTVSAILRQQQVTSLESYSVSIDLSREDSCGRCLYPFNLECHTTIRKSISSCGDCSTSPQTFKVCDYGCAEGRALAIFRAVDTIQRLIGVDVDRKLLVDYCRRLDPLISDFLFRRSTPLHIELFYGSLLDYDHRLNDIDAVTLIEVVEHLNETDLAKVPSAIFGAVAPRLVIVTTPNAEFNVLFPSLTGFRHPDHKFEWTRHQFEQWCKSIATEFSYAVVFGGLGDPPEEFASVGHCTQYAVFTRQQTNSNKIAALDGACAPYECIHAVDYPVTERPASVEEAVLAEAQYYIAMLARHQRARQNEDGDGENAAAAAADDDDDVVVIDVADLMSFTRLRQACSNDAELLRQVLRSAGFFVSDDGLRIHYNDASRSPWDSVGDDDDPYDDTSEAVAPVSINVNNLLITESESWD